MSQAHLEPNGKSEEPVQNQAPVTEAIPFRNTAVTDGDQIGLSFALALLLLGLTMLALRWLQKRGRLPKALVTSQRMKTVERLRLSNRTNLYLVKLDDEVMLVSETINGSAQMSKISSSASFSLTADMERNS